MTSRGRRWPARLGALAAGCTALLAAGCSGSDESAGTATLPSAKAQASFITVDLINDLADMSAVTVYTRPIRIDDPEAAKEGLEPPYTWALYQERLSRGNMYVMTPWAGRYAIAFAPVGQPVSKAVARATFEVTPGAHLVISTAGLAGSGQARVIVQDDRAGRARPGKALVRMWNLLPGTAPLKVEAVAAEPPYISCRRPSKGWVTLATDLRFGEVSRLASLTPGTYHVRASTEDGTPVVEGFLEAPYPQDVMPGSAPLVGESFVTGVAGSDGIRPTIDQARYGVHYPSDC